jgi:hypothetical protein
MQALLSAVALVVLVLGPLVVQCRAPNGTVAAKFIFTECSPEAGCCDLPGEVAAPGATNAGTNSRVIGYGGSTCGSCSERALFLFVGSRGSRDAGQVVGSNPCLLVEFHPASKLPLEIADERLVDATLLDSPPPPVGMHQVLRI